MSRLYMYEMPPQGIQGDTDSRSFQTEAVLNLYLGFIYWVLSGKLQQTNWNCLGCSNVPSKVSHSQNQLQPLIKSTISIQCKKTKVAKTKNTLYKQQIVTQGNTWNTSPLNFLHGFKQISSMISGASLGLTARTHEPEWMQEL